ncbi:PAS domain-containing sensor histidine kinase [Halorubellus salinus]|uniref:PAS domain-containing sensor histidine kinase n=1 Tax=Halorubellus salinus TaxID=755309 RepID=UPI001D081061|nr:PAS domain-containing sensor histidine kinase [Halorubellus salinus]
MGERQGATGGETTRERAIDAAGVAWWEYDVETGAFAFDDRKATLADYDPAAFETVQDFAALVHPGDYDAVAAAFDAVVDGNGDTYDVQYRLRAADGSYRWLRDVGNRSDVDPTLVSGITLPAAAQRERQRVLEDRNEALALVNRIVRHDIRNDLNVLEGWLELIAEDPSLATPDRLEELLTVVDESTTLTESIRDVVTMIESDDDDVETEPVPARSVVLEEVERARAAYPDATLDVGDLPSVNVVANALLTSVFRNLIANAIEHADHDDVTVTVDAAVDGDDVTFTVADDGPGISDDRKAVLFDATASTVDRLDHGLGLYLVHALVSAYGGTVAVADNEPTGTTVTVTLQAA